MAKRALARRLGIRPLSAKYPGVHPSVPGFRESSHGAAASCPLRGFNPSRLRPCRAARCACLRPLACAPSRWTACPPLRLHPVSSPAPAVHAALMVYPSPYLACQGLSRHSLVRCAACVIPRSPGTRNGSGQPGLTATNRRRRADPLPAARSRSSRRGCARCAATLVRRSCPLPPVHSEQAQGQARSAGFIVQ